MIDTNDHATAYKPQTEEEIRASLDACKNGEIKNSLQNCIKAIGFDPRLRHRFRRNLLTEKTDIVGELPWETGSTAMDDTEMNYLLWYLEYCYGLTNEKKIFKALNIVANENRYHPIQDCLNSLTWDGTPRVRYTARLDPAK